MPNSPDDSLDDSSDESFDESKSESSQTEMAVPWLSFLLMAILMLTRTKQWKSCKSSIQMELNNAGNWLISTLNSYLKSTRMKMIPSFVPDILTGLHARSSFMDLYQSSYLWFFLLIFNAYNPYWFNRDRFVLSACHGCMLQYALLHLRPGSRFEAIPSMGKQDTREL